MKSVIGFPPEGDTYRSRRLAGTRKRIWAAALQTIVERGWDKTRILDITRLAGVSHPTFLHHFSSKNDLIAQGAHHYATDIIQAIDAVPRSVPPFPAMRQALVPLAADYVRTPGFRMIMEIFWTNPALRALHSASMHDERNRLADYFDKRLGTRHRISYPSDLLAYTALSALDFAFLTWFRHDLRDVAPIADETFSTLARLATIPAAR